MKLVQGHAKSVTSAAGLHCYWEMSCNMKNNSHCIKIT